MKRKNQKHKVQKIKKNREKSRKIKKSKKESSSSSSPHKHTQVFKIVPRPLKLISSFSPPSTKQQLMTLLLRRRQKLTETLTGQTQRLDQLAVVLIFGPTQELIH